MKHRTNDFSLQDGIRRISSTIQLSKLLVDDAQIKVITSIRNGVMGNLF